MIPDSDSRNATNAERASARVSGLIVAFLALAAFVIAASRPEVLNDGDTWSHVATGAWILGHGDVPRADPFSHSMPGAPWTAHEWLSEILFTLAFRAAGWGGVILLTAFAAASTALIMGLRVARDLSGLALAVVLVFGGALWAPQLLARPHLIALPIAAVWTVGLLAARDRGAPPPLILALLMTVWSNLHGSFVFGLALIAPFALEALAEARSGERLSALRGWAVFACAAVAAALVNPYGVEALLFPFRLLGVEHLARVAEWGPQDFGRLNPMAMALMALLYFALTRPMRAPPIRVLVVIGLVAMALAHVRHMQLLGLIAPMLLARPIAEAIGARAPAGVRPAARIALAVSLAGALVVAGLRLAHPIARTDGPNAPIAALAAVPAELREKPALNQYGFGGYLIFAHVRPFIDGRADMYGGAMLDLYSRLAGGDPETVEATLARYHIAWTIFAPDDRIVAVLDHTPGWRRLYAGRFAVVHVREDALPSAPASGAAP